MHKRGENPENVIQRGVEIIAPSKKEEVFKSPLKKEDRNYQPRTFMEDKIVKHYMVIKQGDKYQFPIRNFYKPCYNPNSHTYLRGTKKNNREKWR